MDDPKGFSVDRFLGQQERWLAMEREAELAQSRSLLEHLDAKELEKRGLALRQLVLASHRTGLYGRTILSLVSSHPNLPNLPAHSITSGDIVSLANAKENSSHQESGVVINVSSSAIQVSFESSLDAIKADLDDRLNITKLANDVTYKRLSSALSRIKSEARHQVLENCLLGISTLSPPLQSVSPNIRHEDGSIRFVNDRLDDSQRSAVEFALLQKELAVVHGPPGTGKTTTIVEIITQAVRSGNRVLCCAPSNVAVDNLLDRLVKNKVRVVRLGHPARVNKDLQKFSLDAQIDLSDQTQLVRDIRGEIDSNFSKIKKSRSKGEQSGLRREIKELRKELHDRERSAMKEILKQTEVVLGTLTSASPDGPLKHLPENHFDITVIDECSQALELACWIPLPFAKKAILAGDHLQLPPTIMCEQAAKEGLNFTLMERVIKQFGSSIVRMLKVQYRMNEAIMRWASEALYQGELQAHESVRGHLLQDLDWVQATENTSIPLLLIDTTGCDMPELATPDEISKANEGEVALVCLHVEELIKSGLKAAEIAVITPYNLQVELIRLQLAAKFPGLEVRSVDGFQGREKEAVVLSLVRSNPNKDIGFLAESRRLNVAVTRARRHVAVICNSETVSTDKFLKAFLDYLEKHGEVRTALQYQNEIDALNLVRPEGMELTIKDQIVSKPRKETQKTKKESSVAKKEKKSKDTPTVKSETHHVKAQAEVAGQDEGDLSEKEDIDPDVVKREQFQATIQKFMSDSDQSSHDFSSDLNSHDRMVVHEIAETLDLIHESVGEGKKRHILIRKKVTEVKETPVQKAAFDDGMLQCSGCLARLPKANMELHKVRCRRSHAAVPNPPPVEVAKAVAVKAKKKKAKSAGKAADDEQDIDKLLERFSKLDKMCNHEKCKAKIATLGVNCEFCRVRFCLEHSLPEIHGCGSAARSAARQQISRSGRIFSGSGVPSMKPDPNRRAQLHFRLDKKLNSLGDERKAKQPEKKT
eukprot:maker-scaffold1716_size30199-snap-gene-0.9 protein:Tk10403 transcript:maker-scaffold1716_size30199-snap-gene-0.9-mRNA-1 annotation:"dna-binding protein smubp-2"